MRKRERRMGENGKEIGTRAGRGIDIGGPGGDGDGTKGGPGAAAGAGERPRHKYAEN